ncbi:hypothetical protein MASR1M65_15850 [Saprospiraceae bacterium]
MNILSHDASCSARKSDRTRNPSVGAVIVKNGEIVAETEAGKSKNDITCHAEIEALRLAVKKLQSNDLSECVMYSTHEPCIMCSYAIRYYRVKKLVYLHDVDYLGGINRKCLYLYPTLCLRTGVDHLR